MNRVNRTLWCTAFVAAAMLAALSCSGTGTGPKPTAAGTKKDDHPETGPHGGFLGEVGDKEEYHAELVVDRGKKHATVYILDGEAKKAAPIKAKAVTLTLKAEKPPLQIELTPEKQAGDPEGATSRFVKTHDKFAAELDRELIDIRWEIDGQTQEGSFKKEKK